MHTLKKLCYFLIGLIFIPDILDLSIASIIPYGKNRAAVFFEIVYFAIYIIFPFLYRPKIKAKIPNRYVFYLILYLPFIAFFMIYYGYHH